MSESDNDLPELVKSIINAPKTWFPALLQIVIQQSMEKDVFKDILTYCERVIAENLEKVIESDPILTKYGMQSYSSGTLPLDEPLVMEGYNVEKLELSCTQCGHIRPIAPNNNGVCYECLRLEAAKTIPLAALQFQGYGEAAPEGGVKKVLMAKGWKDDDAK